MHPIPATEPETVAESRSYVSLKRIRDGYSWTIGANVDVTLEELELAMENALLVDAQLRQRLGV